MSIFGRRSHPQDYEFWALATYNAERSRGIVHTKEWDEQMAREQARFDQQQAMRCPDAPVPLAPGKIR